MSRTISLVNQAHAANAARSTASSVTPGASALVLALLALTQPIDFGAEPPGPRLRVVLKSQDATHLVSRVIQDSIESRLASGLLNVFLRISENQRELDREAKRILYSRTRELYRR